MIKNEPHDFARDTSGALLNTNDSALKQYKRTKKKFKRLDDIDRLDRELAELKSIVSALIKGEK